jgi:succinate dehydrogenase / fumarate reductase iron-sulfur subunit
VDRNNGERHEAAFVQLIEKHGLLWEAELLPRSYGGPSWFGKFHPAAGQELLSSLPVITKAVLRRKVTPMGAIKAHNIPQESRKQIQEIYRDVHARDERREFNLYISGTDANNNEPVPERVEATGDANAEDNA